MSRHGEAPAGMAGAETRQATDHPLRQVHPVSSYPRGERLVGSDEEGQTVGAGKRGQAWRKVFDLRAAEGAQDDPGAGGQPGGARQDVRDTVGIGEQPEAWPRRPRAGGLPAGGGAA